MPAVPTRLALRSARRRAMFLPPSHDRGQRALHERRRPRRRCSALVARQQQLGLVGDRQVGRPAASSFSGAAGSDGACESHVEPGPLEVAARLRRVDAGVVGVGEEVEHERRRLAACGARRSLLLLAAARASAQRGERAAARRGDGGVIAGSSVRSMGPGHERGARPARGAEERDGERGEQHDGGVRARGLELRDGLQDQVAEPVARARLLGEARRRSRRRRRRSSRPRARPAAPRAPRRRRKACQREASSVRISLRWSGSTRGQRRRAW